MQATVEVPDWLAHAIQLRVDEINNGEDELYDRLRSGKPVVNQRDFHRFRTRVTMSAGGDLSSYPVRWTSIPSVENSREEIHSPVPGEPGNLKILGLLDFDLYSASYRITIGRYNQKSLAGT
jgi:hypothetical protein